MKETVSLPCLPRDLLVSLCLQCADLVWHCNCFVVGQQRQRVWVNELDGQMRHRGRPTPFSKANCKFQTQNKSRLHIFTWCYNSSMLVCCSFSSVSYIVLLYFVIPISYSSSSSVTAVVALMMPSTAAVQQYSVIIHLHNKYNNTLAWNRQLLFRTYCCCIYMERYTRYNSVPGTTLYISSTPSVKPSFLSAGGCDVTRVRFRVQTSDPVLFCFFFYVCFFYVLLSGVPVPPPAASISYCSTAHIYHMIRYHDDNVSWLARCSQAFRFSVQHVVLNNCLSVSVTWRRASVHTAVSYSTSTSQNLQTWGVCFVVVIHVSRNKTGIIVYREVRTHATAYQVSQNTTLLL